MTDGTQHDRPATRADRPVRALRTRLELKVKSKLLQVRLKRIDSDIQRIARTLRRSEFKASDER